MVTVQVGRDVDLYYAIGNSIHGLVSHKFGSGIRIGFVNNMTYDIEHNVEKYTAPGRRYGWGIKAGALDVTINLEGLWVDSGAQQLFHNEAEKSGALTAFAIGASGTDKGIAFSGCRMNSVSIEFDSEGWCTQNVEIPALLPV